MRSTAIAGSGVVARRSQVLDRTLALRPNSLAQRSISARRWWPAQAMAHLLGIGADALEAQQRNQDSQPGIGGTGVLLSGHSQIRVSRSKPMLLRYGDDRRSKRWPKAAPVRCPGPVYRDPASRPYVTFCPIDDDSLGDDTPHIRAEGPSHGWHQSHDRCRLSPSTSFATETTWPHTDDVLSHKVTSDRRALRKCGRIPAKRARSQETGKMESGNDEPVN